MLYLIGGTSRSGKSLISRRLLKAKGISYLPLDSVVMGFTRGIPKYGVHDKLFPDEIAKRMWPFVKAMCDDLIYVGKDYAIEGEAILPVNVRALLDRHPRKIKTCFLGYCEIDLEQKVRDIKTYHEGSRDWLVNESDAYIKEHVKNMIRYSHSIRKQCQTHKIRYFDVSQSFKPTLHKALRYLLHR